MHHGGKVLAVKFFTLLESECDYAEWFQPTTTGLSLQKIAPIRFRATEIKTGGLFGCSARNITVHMKPGSIPLVNPDQSKLPANLLEARTAHYTLLFASDGTQQVQNISAPIPGDWFAIAFRSWSDPNSEKIGQQGKTLKAMSIRSKLQSLVRSYRLCQTIFESMFHAWCLHN